MEIIIQPTPEAATSVASRIIARLLCEKPDAVLGLATGSTPLLLYRELIALKLDWHRVTTFNLDEYVGLADTHPQVLPQLHVGKPFPARQHCQEERAYSRRHDAEHPEVLRAV